MTIRDKISCLPKDILNMNGGFGRVKLETNKKSTHNRVSTRSRSKVEIS